MARDAAATRARIFEAATAEFAEHGISGARIDRIARRANANKQLIYAYFGDKLELFGQVLEGALLDLARAVPIDPDDLGGWIDQLQEYHAAHPEVLRLMLWEALERGGTEVVREPQRRAHYQEKVARLADAQRRGTIDAALPPADLTLLLIALVNWPAVVPQLRRMLVGEGPEAEARLRESVRVAAHRIARPEPEHR